MKLRVGFLTSHPIQYQVPIFRHLAEKPDLDFTVFYCQIPDAKVQGDGFGVSFNWDLPLLDGYRYEVLKNVSASPGVTQFAGCDTPEIATMIRTGGFDAFIVNGWVVKSCLQALWACRRNGVPCIVRGEANDLRPRAWWKRVMQRQLVRQYSAFLYIGQANADFYRARGIPQSRLFPALYCVENQRFQQAAAHVDKAVARQRFGLKQDSIVYLFSGKLIAKKHPLRLLQAIQSAAVRNPRIELLMVGDGELRVECETYARELHLPVHFAGFLNQSQIVGAYVACDCLVLPSDHGETWGLVVNEAMACGRPAIVSDQVGCASDLVIPGRTGNVFPFGQWDCLSDMLNRMAEDSLTLAKWGTAAVERISLYSPAAAADGIQQAVEFVHGRSGHRQFPATCSRSGGKV
jgi:glycosyltransferase involved in cell wall biosynthesis